MYINFNANPTNKRRDDCVIRAISKATGKSWDDVYMDLCMEGLLLHDMPSANHVWGSYLKKHGYTRHVIPNSCPDCYTVQEFTEDFPYGKYILALHGHTLAAIDGNYYDTWDSGQETILFYWKEDY